MSPFLLAAVASSFVSVATPGLELLSDAGPAEAAGLSVRLQRFAAALRGFVPATPAGPAGTVVLALRDRDLFRELTPRRDGTAVELAGFFQGAGEHRFVVVDLGSADAGRVALHEMTHLVLGGALPAEPVWLSEGLAELFSTLVVPEEGPPRVGEPIEAHVRLLRARGLLPLEAVLRTDYGSETYLRGPERGRFYAQCWLLAHWLLVERDDGPAALARLTSAVARGTPAVEALPAAVSLDLPGIEAALRAAVEGGAWTARAMPVPPEGAIVADAVPPVPGRLDHLLGVLLLAQDRPEAAERRLRSALASDPTLAAAHGGLARLELGRRRYAEARQHVQKALGLAPGQPTALLRYAEALVREAAARNVPLEGPDEEAAVAALEKALTGAPQLLDAAELLARVRPQPFGDRAEALERALALVPARVDAAITLADLHLKRSDLQAAAAVLRRARDVAREEWERFLCDHLLGQIGPAAGRAAEARGELRSVRCHADGSLDFVVQSGGRKLTLRAATAVSVFLYDRRGNRLQRELTCGPLAEAVRASYLPDGDGGGTLVGLTFTGR